MKKSLSQKVLLSAAAVTTAVGLAGVGTLAGWTKSESDNHVVTAGTFDLGRINVGDDASNFVPGDSMQRLLTISHAGDVAYGSLNVATTVPEGDAGDDLVKASDDDSLRISIDRCSVPWTASGLTYTCTGEGATTTGVVSAADVLGSFDLPGSPALPDNGVDYLRLTVALPGTNTNYAAYNGESVTINYTVTAAQRAGTNK